MVSGYISRSVCHTSIKDYRLLSIVFNGINQFLLLTLNIDHKMGKKHKADSYGEFERISNRIQYFIATRCFSSYEGRRICYESIKADISAVSNVIVYEQLMAKLKAAGI